MSQHQIVSVIIPVFNAASFLENCILSALQFKEVKEVILVEDMSTDNSLEVCFELEHKYERVRLFQHPDGKNHGAGASRNLGVKMASAEWIAFLDADDKYLKNRFNAEKKALFNNSDPSIDGMYSNITSHYLEEGSKEKYQLVDTTVNHKVHPEELKYVLLNMHKRYNGHFHLDALTVKKKLIEKVGGFSRLAVHQDTDLCIKLAFAGNLLSGNLNEFVASRGVHMNNRIYKVDFNKLLKSRYLLFLEVEKWLKQNYPEEINANLFVQYERELYEFINKEKSLNWLKTIRFFIRKPYLFFDNKKSEWLLKATLGNSRFSNLLIKIKEKFLIVFFNKKIKKWDLYIE